MATRQALGFFLIAIGFGMVLWPAFTGQQFALPAVVPGIGVLVMLGGVAWIVILDRPR